ncbi:MAG: hypothetical protein C5B53_07510 [Candidatus Melainabacteria bacterium]|nr:MAG: hypothetical protein C5B53_07510 [Candidatus Melainabacteria bacterium]
MKYNSLIWAFLFSLPLFAWLPAIASSITSSSKITIVDDGAKNASFVKFRSQLLSAVKQRDKKFLQEATADDIKTGLGAATGWHALNEQWHNLSPDSSFWSRLERALKHAAHFDKESGEYEAPAIVFDPADGEKIEAAIWDKNSILRKSPSDSSKALRLLDCQLVTVLKPGDPAPIKAEWVEVKTRDGKTGFVKSANLLSPYDEYATFKKVKGKWRMTWFGVAGL